MLSGKNSLIIDSKAPSIPFAEYAAVENRYRALRLSNPEMADELPTLPTLRANSAPRVQ